MEWIKKGSKMHWREIKEVWRWIKQDQSWIKGRFGGGGCFGGLGHGIKEEKG